MITLTSAPSASSALMAGLQEEMQRAGQTGAPAPSGHVPAAASTPSGGAVSASAAAMAPTDSPVGTILNERA